MSSDGGLFESIFAGDAVLAATSDRAWVAAMLRFESALAQAESSLGIVPAGAARRIADACRSLEPDPAALGRSARGGGNPAIPLLARLRGALDPEAAGWVHFGATSQDAVDTALMLVAADVLPLVLADLDRLAEAAAGLARRYRSTPIAGRTLLQQAGPTTFGAKVAGWLVAALDARRILADVRAGRLAVQLGGATGTLAALGADGPAVMTRLAADLGLAVPVLPWHSDRTRVLELAGALAPAAGVAGKIGTDVALLMQTEVGEVAEPEAPGRGVSSALPHKRNPVLSTVMIANSRRAAALLGGVAQASLIEHERGAGSWHTEWQTMTALFRAVGGAVSSAAEALAGLQVDEKQMAVNLERTGGLIMAERVTHELARQVGYTEARQQVDEAVASGRPLREAIPVDGSVFDPAGWLGSAEDFVDRALAYYSGQEQGMEEHTGQPPA